MADHSPARPEGDAAPDDEPLNAGVCVECGDRTTGAACIGCLDPLCDACVAAYGQSFCAFCIEGDDLWDDDCDDDEEDDDA